MKIHTGDQVIITAGKDKNRQGKVEKVFPQSDQVLVSGLNVYKRAKKRYGQEPGGLIEFNRPLPIGNVALLCATCKKPTRVSYKVDKSGGKRRICAKCGSEVDNKGGTKK